MIDGDRISIEVDGELVHGRITYLSARDITVALEPTAREAKALASGGHIPVLAAACLRFEENGAITDRGRQRAEQLLQELHRAHRIPPSRRSRLEALYASELARLNPPDALDEEGLREARTALRKAMRAESLDPRENQRRLVVLKERREAHRRAETEALEVVADAIKDAHGLSLGDDLVRSLLAL